MYKKKFLISKMVNYVKLFILVPIISATKVNFSYDIYTRIIAFVLLLLSLWFMARIIRLPTQQWKVLDILRLLLGIPKLQPKRVTERVIFFCTALLALTFSSEILSILTSIQVEHKTLAFDTFADIVKSKVTLYSYAPINTKLYVDDDKNLKKIVSNVKPIGNLNECVVQMVTTKTAACITTSYYAQHIMIRYLPKYGSPLIKKSYTNVSR